MIRVQSFFELIFDFMNDIFNLLNSARFEFFGTTVYLGWLLVAFVVISIVVSVFWKGARG